MSDRVPTPDNHEEALGFLTVAQTIALGVGGVRGAGPVFDADLLERRAG